MLTKAPKARLSIDFNMALLNGGDKMFAAQQDVLALLFYNLVLPPARLLEANQKLEADLVWRRNQFIKAGQVEFVVDINRRIQDLQNERALLEETPDFSEDLLMRIAQAYFAPTDSTRRFGRSGRSTRTIRTESWPKTPATAHSLWRPSSSRTQRRRKRASSTWRPFPKASSGRT